MAELYSRRAHWPRERVVRGERTQFWQPGVAQLHPDPSTNHDHLRIKQIDQAGHRYTDVAYSSLDDLVRNRVALPRGSHQRGDAGSLIVVVQQCAARCQIRQRLHNTGRSNIGL